MDKNTDLTKVSQSKLRERYLAFYEHLFPNEFSIELPECYEQLINIMFSIALKPRDRKIVIARFGLNGKPLMSFTKICKEFRLSRLRVREIIARSCIILRDYKEYLLPYTPVLNSTKRFMMFLADLRDEYPYRIMGDYDTYDRYNMAWNDCLNRVEDWVTARMKEDGKESELL